MANPPLVFKTTAKAWVYDGDLDTLTQITDPDYPTTTVPGIVYLDGTYYVMTPNGSIYGSDIALPLSWTALNVINAEVEPDGGVAIAKYLNYLVAFGIWTTEVFYDNRNPPPGSPLLRAENALMLIGCAHARSIAHCENSIVWMAQTKEGQSAASAGRSIVKMEGFQPKPISTPFIDRILNADNLATVYSYAFKHNGHSFYVLTLGTSNITLVYDFTVGLWYQWTSMTAQGTKSVSALTYDSTTGLCTATVNAHGYADGDLGVIAGASPADYNGTFNFTYVDANHFSYRPLTVPATTPATGTITSMGYTEGHFRVIMHSTIAGDNYFLDESNGTLYKMLESDYNDNGTYINFLIRTTNIDMKNNNNKKITRLDLIGDKAQGSAMIRYSKDDYQSFSTYRKVDLSLKRSMLKRIGMARRMPFDIRVTDFIPVRLERMDITIDGE